MEVRKNKRKKKEQPLKISGNFTDVLKVAVKENPKSINKGKKNGKNI